MQCGFSYVSLLFHILSWIGFHIKLQEKTAITQSNVGYLDCLDAPVTDMSTICHMMQQSVRIKEQLKLKPIVCVYDQAIYAKAFQTKYAEPDRFKDVFLMIGTFHVILTFLAVIAIRFRDAGLRDIVVQITIAAERSVDTIFGGSRAYNRTIRIYKIFYEAFYQILMNDFELGYPTEAKKIEKQCQLKRTDWFKAVSLSYPVKIFTVIIRSS